MRSARGLALAAMVLLIAACTPERGAGDAASPTVRVQVSAEEPTEVDEAVEEVEAPPPALAPTGSEDGAAASGEADEGSTESVAEPAEQEPTTGPAASPAGPQLCSTVTTTVGDLVTVEIVAGEIDCASAEALLDAYYNDPPSVPEGSGAYLTIGGWECNSSSSQEPGRLSTCRAAGDGEIIAIAGEAPEGGWCELIDDLTLDQLFADGEPVEAVCATYIDAETSIDQQ